MERKKKEKSEEAILLSDFQNKPNLSLKSCSLIKLPSCFTYSKEKYVKVTSIDLSENSLGDLPDSFFELFPNTETLVLQHNRLSLLSSKIVLMKNLGCLKLDDNNLSCLPRTISGLTHLWQLTVSHNQLVGVPSNLSPVLKILNLSENIIQILPQEIGNLNQLQELMLYHNKFVAIPSSLWRLRNLSTFSLEWFRYALPPFPTHLKGSLFASILEQLRELLKIISANNMRECAFTAFVSFFSEIDFDPSRVLNDTFKIPKKYIGKSFLQIGALENDIGVLESLIPLHPNLNFVNSEGFSSLGIAIKENHKSIVMKLLNSPIDVNIGSGKSGNLVNLAIEHLLKEIFNNILFKIH